MNQNDVYNKVKEFKIIVEDKLLVHEHPSYNPNGQCFITDTYPDFKRKQHLYIYKDDKDELIEVASIYSNIKYRNDCRCDFHPRWNHSGNKICFDGAQGKKRQVYIIDVGDKL